MQFSSLHARRLAVVGLASLAIAGAAGCGSNDDSSASTASQPAASAPAAGDSALSTADAKALTGARDTIDAYCKDKAAHAGELDGAVATLESLYQIDPKATSGGTSVEEVVADSASTLRACGAKAGAKRLAALKG